MKNKPLKVFIVRWDKSKSGARMPLITTPANAYAALRVRLAKESGLAPMAGERGLE